MAGVHVEASVSYPCALRQYLRRGNIVASSSQPLGVVFCRAGPVGTDCDEGEQRDLNEHEGNGACEAGPASRSGRVLRPADVAALGS